MTATRKSNTIAPEDLIRGGDPHDTAERMATTLEAAGPDQGIELTAAQAVPDQPHRMARAGVHGFLRRLPDGFRLEIETADGAEAVAIHDAVEAERDELHQQQPGWGANRALVALMVNDEHDSYCVVLTTDHARIATHVGVHIAQWRHDQELQAARERGAPMSRPSPEMN